MALPPEIGTEEEVLNDLKAKCQRIRELIRPMMPQALVGYLWAQVLMSLMGRHDPDQDGDGLPSFSPNEQSLLFAMEYVHATVSVDGLPSSFDEFDETAANQVVELSQEALALCFQYAMIGTHKGTIAPRFEDERLAFQILSNWVLIRGRRYQVMEEEFFQYVLLPHDEAIKETYGIGSAELAKELQKAADAPRVGFDNARTRMIEIMELVDSDQAAEPTDMQATIEKAKEKHPELAEEAASIFEDMFNAGLFNLTKQTGIPPKLLADLAFEPAEDDAFDDGTDVSGTPFKTLPARVKPLLKLGSDFYCTEPNFIRDASYRAIQRALIRRKPEYKEDWNRIQKEMSENALPDLMANHLNGAQVFKDVYYPIGKKQWAETDCVILLEDVMINVEAKAGSEALSAPAENLKGHIDRVGDLVEKAYLQSKRFIDYLHSKDEAALYEKLPDGKYREVSRVQSQKLRHIFPIGLTVEAFTPFSAAIKENENVSPIQDRYNFISLSIDDLMVIRRLLAGTGEFLHYLDVRQALAGLKNVMLFDEMDHLGIYISQNRADQRLREMIDEHKADQVWVDGMDEDVIGPYFYHPDWPDTKIPAQEYPARTAELLRMLEETGAPNWLEADSFIRDMSGEGRNQFSEYFERVSPILNERPATFFAIGGPAAAVFGLMRDGSRQLTDFVKFRAEAAALAFETPKLKLFELVVGPDMSIQSARMRWVSSPPVIRNDYSAVVEEAKRLKDKFKPL